MDDRTSDLTDERLAAVADEAWDKANMCLGGGLPDRCAAALRAVAALARQGWAPVGTGPSLEDLGPLIVWLGDAAIQAADAGRSDDAGKLTWALQIVSERVDEDAPDHIADVSNMVESAPDTVYSEHSNPTQCTQ